MKNIESIDFEELTINELRYIEGGFLQALINAIAQEAAEQAIRYGIIKYNDYRSDKIVL